MTIEILYSDICNLYGDLFNIKYLEKCLPDATFKYTAINDEPHFFNNKVDFIYLGPMSEKSQEIVIEKLKPYKNKIEEMIENNVIFLVTGNALEVFGSYIKNEDSTKIEGLNIFDIYAKRDMMNRFSSLVLGTFENIEIVGFKNQFTQMYGDNEDKYFLDVQRGPGINPKSKKEGIHKNNFFGTYILGPILVLNPLFTKYLLKLLSVESKLAFEEEAILAYNKRLEEFKDKTKTFN